MELMYLLKGSKAMMTMLLLALSMSLAGNFGDATMVNETIPYAYKAYFGGTNSSLLNNGQFYTVYVQNDSHPFKEHLMLASSFIGNGGLYFWRTALDEHWIPHFRALTGVGEPVMGLNPHGNFIIIYPKTEFYMQNNKTFYNLHRLILDDQGTVLARDSLYSNVYYKSQLLADNSKVNLLFKEGTDDIDISSIHQYIDIHETLHGSSVDIRYSSGDIIHGRVHSNTDIWLRANSWPTFHGLVTTAGQVRVFPGGGTSYPRDQIFLGGLIENYSTLELPEGARDVRRYGAYPLGRNERDDAIAYVTVDGSIYDLWLGEIIVEDVQDPDFEWVEDCNQFTIYNSYPPYDAVGQEIGVNRIPRKDTIWTNYAAGRVDNGSVFIPMELWISGEFEGKQTWASSHDIYLKGDLTYRNTEPGLPPDGGFDNQYPVNETDYLGIVSEKSIYIQYGNKSPIDSLRHRPNTEDIYMYGSYFALGRGEYIWEDGIVTFQYQFPKGSTPPQYWGAERFTKIDLHRFNYPTTAMNPWPPGLDYPWYNPLWPEPGEIYGFEGFTRTPNPHDAPEIAKLRGTVNLFGSIAQRRWGYMRRSGNLDFDTGIWDIHNEIQPYTPPRYGAPNPSIGPTGYDRNYHNDSRLDHNSAPHLPKDDHLSPYGRKFHYWTSVDGNDFTPVFSGELESIDKCLKMAVHGSSVAILVDRGIYLFPENSTEYERFEIGIPAENTVREMLYTENGLYLLATSYLEDEETYLSKLYHFSLQDNSLVVLDEKSLPDLIQTIHLFNNHILWAAAVDADRVEIYKYYHSGRVRASAVWEHNIERPSYYSKESGTLALDSESDMIFITLNYRRTDWHPYSYDYGGNIYTAFGTFEFTAVEEDDELPLTPSASLTHFPNPVSRNELLAGTLMNISFALPEKSNVKIDVYNIRGQHIRSLVSEEYQRGEHNISWDGTDKNNNRIASGVYFYQMKTNDNVSSRKMLILK